jgi:hypothetical protein
MIINKAKLALVLSPNKHEEPDHVAGTLTASIRRGTPAVVGAVVVDGVIVLTSSTSWHRAWSVNSHAL